MPEAFGDQDALKEAEEINKAHRKVQRVCRHNKHTWRAVSKSVPLSSPLVGRICRSFSNTNYLLIDHKK